MTATGKESKEKLSGLVKKTNLRVILMGMRRTDPGCKEAGFFDPSSSSWPPFMRVFPIINWNYQDIWTFLIHFKLKYCSLYDQVCFE
jgi:FAD synthetase